MVTWIDRGNTLIVGKGLSHWVRRRKYKLGQTKQNPSDGGLLNVSAPGVGSFGYGAMRFKSSQSDWII